MDPQIQTYLALVVVAVATVGLGWKYFGKRKGGGCGGDCGCSTSELKAKIKR